MTTPQSRERVKAQARAFLNGQSDEEIPELVTPFPVEVLPDAVRRYAEEAAAAIPVPVEMVAMPLLAMAGGVIGNRAYLHLKRGWYEYPTLFMMVVAGPGKNKSAAIKAARWPVKALQKDAKRWHSLEFAKYEAEKREWKNTKASQRGEEPKPPKMRHYFTTDVTMEALAGMLERAPGISISSDELSGWVKRMNQYRQGGDREQYMSIWAAEPMKVDRKGGGSVYVETPVVSVFGGIQPDVVPTLHSDAQIRDGFVERLLPFLPVLPPKKWVPETQISAEAYSGVSVLFRALDRLALVDDDDDVDGTPPGVGVRLSLGADRIWGRWSDENNELAAKLGGFVGGYYTKLEAHAARFALILHILGNHQSNRDDLSPDTMRDAIELAEYFRSQMQLFLPMLGASTGPSKGVGLLDRMARLIDRKGRTLELSNARTLETRNAKCISTDELLRGLGNVRKEEVTKELDTQNDHIRVFQETIPTGNNPMVAYCLNEDENPSFRETPLRGFEGSSIREIELPKPPSVTGGLWDQPAPWEETP